MAAAVPITTAPMNAVSRKEVRWDGDMKLMLRHDTIGRVVRLTPWSESAASMIHWGLNGVGWLAGQPANLTDEGIHSGESLIAWVDRCGHAVAGMLQGLSRKASRSAV